MRATEKEAKNQPDDDQSLPAGAADGKDKKKTAKVEAVKSISKPENVPREKGVAKPDIKSQAESHQRRKTHEVAQEKKAAKGRRTADRLRKEKKSRKERSTENDSESGQVATQEPSSSIKTSEGPIVAKEAFEEEAACSESRRKRH